MRVPQPGMLCGVCGLPVLYHVDRVKEMVPGPDGTMRMQLYHSKRCWPRLRKKRMKEARKAKAMTEQTPPTPPEPAKLELVPRIAPGQQRRTGLGQLVYNILDTIPQGQEWTIEEILQRLSIYNITTTRGSVTQTCYMYKTQRRKTALMRTRPIAGSMARTRVFVFEEPTPTTPARITSSSMAKRRKYANPTHKTKAEIIREHEDIPRPAPQHLQTPAPPKAERVEPAPAPGLTRADINRAFNDFQAFLLETLADFRNDFLKKVRN